MKIPRIPNPMKLLRKMRKENGQDKIKPDPVKLEQIRHSLAHLFAAAVMELWPDTKRTIGPAIDNGFYFDFQFSNPINETDLSRIEKKMREILPTWTSFEKYELSAEEAKREYPDNPYKHELVDEFTKNGQKVNFYKSGEYWDLCKGGHVENPAKEIDPESFKLSHIAGAYWRGDEKNKMLTRIYGLAFESKDALNKYVAMQEEAKKRDHRKLGKELGLFVFSDVVGKGLPLWTAKGATIRRTLERFIIDEEIRRGYTHVITPDIASLNLFKKSGHYPYYKDSMYAPITIDDEEFMLRPMTCPHHFELYINTGPHSYRELPMRIAEIAKLYRYEQSGELSGLIRLRTFSLADAHIICADPSQAKDEVRRALDLIEFCTEKFGFSMGKEYRYRLSLGNRENKEKYYDNQGGWEIAEEKLREVLKERKCEYFEAPDEAAFYGPKIDVQMRNVNDKEDTAFTVQYDFCMPGRFNLKYVNQKGEEQQPIVVHRSSIGAVERILAFIIEHTAGAFPFWLAPVQVKVLPITDTQKKYAKEVQDKLVETGIRSEIDIRAESLGKKIRDAKIEKIPYLIIIGEKEQKENKVTLESRDNGNQGITSINDLLAKFQKENKV